MRIQVTFIALEYLAQNLIAIIHISAFISVAHIQNLFTYLVSGLRTLFKVYAKNK